MDAKAKSGEKAARTIRRYVLAALDQLQNLPHAPSPETETASLKWVRQARRYPIWRTSHPFHPDVAVRLICWFPPDADLVVVALLAADKAQMADVFYNNVGTRADALIEQWKRQAKEQS